MTARRFPDAPAFASPAERLFTEALQEQLPDDAVLFCGQRFSDHRQDREADLIVAWPGVGIAVIEVKGGSVYLQDGEWHQAGGGIDNVIHPVDQARTCKYLLRNYLDKHPRWSAGNPRLGHLVALPTTTLPEDFRAPDLPRWMVIDQSDLPYAASRIEAALRKLVEVPESPTTEDVEALVDCLAGAAIPQQDLVADLAEREAACDLLTRDQADVLDRLQLLNRVEIRGGAGSGKTWLAVEKARRLAQDGKRVALMCYSRGLAEFLTRRVDTLPRRHRPTYVGTFHNLGIGWGVEPGSDDDSSHWEELLPGETEFRAVCTAVTIAARRGPGPPAGHVAPLGSSPSGTGRTVTGSTGRTTGPAIVRCAPFAPLAGAANGP